MIGIYSGIIGYLSVTGAASFNVVIRTAIIGPQGRKREISSAVDSDVLSHLCRYHDRMWWGNSGGI